ncbi:nucleotide-binding domain-containing protein [Fragilariopsis cylindrus CCMP1102]|uniref:Nucleotide-binding domain-containing protein n=1 Tax=Fragilariopsis cylindrus CCMP1102 TaxID=635003 RepID=A0A1E7EZ57_9STRA|nr:nucleotide-binding domain-containing protein [Fragilariopsis cylindrus CCMP1102]|eukprot:OEU11085.1 nucleotide-binding domain-containing protein [Fragilariopsis cylindrus CCMP1102]
MLAPLLRPTTIVGSGPSGCYTAKYLLQSMKKLNTTENSITTPRYYSCTIDILERLPTPYGLVRNGVAPDHPEVKNVQNDFNDLFNLNNNIDCSVQFYGNVTVGGDDRNDHDNDNKRSNDSNSTAAAQKANANANNADISLHELRSIYDIVVLAYGCESDREFHLPIDIIEDEDSNDDTTINTTTTTTIDTIDTSSASVEVDGIVSARQFVNWYNGHPDYGNDITTKVQNALWNNKNDKDKDNETETDENTQQQQNKQEQNIVIIGHGNVALDCGRILAKSRQQLNTTDLTTRSLNILRPENPNPDSEFESTQSSSTQSSSTQPQRNISIIGRRGHIQGAFTIKEVRELTKLNNDNDNDNGNNDKDNENENENENKKDNDVLFVVRQEELDMDCPTQL